MSNSNWGATQIPTSFASVGQQAIEAFRAQAELQPGEQGWWKVWGAWPQHVRAGDIVILKNNDEADTVYIADLFTAKAAPVRVGWVDQDGNRFTYGALCPIVLVRQGTHNTLA